MEPDDEQAIRRVLQAGAPTKPMTQAERARILDRLATATGADSSAARAADVVELDAPIGDREPRGSSWGTGRRVLLAAAAALLVVAMVVTRPDTPSDIATSPSEVEGSCPSIEWNRDHVGPLAEAVARWRTVENWAFTQGEPDLAPMVESALMAAEATFDDPSATSAGAALDAFRSALASIDDASIVDALETAEARVAAVGDGIAALDEISRTFDQGCDVTLIQPEG